MNSIYGLNIYENQHLPEFTPRMKLKPGDYVSDAMRSKIDAWLVEFFGKDRTVLQIGNDLFMHPATARIVREQMS